MPIVHCFPLNDVDARNLLLNFHPSPSTPRLRCRLFAQSLGEETLFKKNLFPKKVPSHQHHISRLPFKRGVQVTMKGFDQMQCCQLLSKFAKSRSSDLLLSLNREKFINGQFLNKLETLPKIAKRIRL